MAARTEAVTSADGTTIGFERFGEGPTLIAIHGGVADHTRWAATAEVLAEDFTLLLVDRRGRGLSLAEGEGEYALEREVEDVAAVVEAAGEPVRVLGHSYGGLVALEAALVVPEIERMVVYEPAFDTPGHETFPHGVQERVDGLIAADKREEGLELFFTAVVGAGAEQLEAMKGTPVWEARLAAAQTISREGLVVRSHGFDPARFAGLGLPIRFLLGTESPPPLQASTRAAHAAIAGSELVELDGQGHAAMDTDTERFTRTVTEFLA